MSSPLVGKWVFGYGSLIWRPDFKFAEKRVGYIKNGMRRRFYQGSTDHRGVPGAPGRVVTLIDSSVPDPFDQEVHELMKEIPTEDSLREIYKKSFKGTNELTYGVAYRIDDSDVDAIFSYLHHREKGGYKCYDVEVFFSDNASPEELVNGTSASQSCIAACWVATPENEEYLGHAPIGQIAHQVVSSHGPSGPNSVYLLQLSQALNDLNCPDISVDLLARKVRHIMSEQENTKKIEEKE